MKINHFEDLEVWKLSIEVTKEIYSITGNKPFAKDFGLKDQIRRATVSISSNIAEGFEKNNNNEFIRYLKISKGSAGEVRSQLYIARMLNYISEEEFGKINESVHMLSNQIGKFMSYLENKRKNREFLTR